MSDFKSPSYDGMKTPFIVSIGCEQTFIPFKLNLEFLGGTSTKS